MSGSQYTANETISVGQSVTVSMCHLSTCDIEPYTFSAGVYKDLADNYGSTVGQIQMLSPTYNYIYIANEGRSYPSIGMTKSCLLLSSNYNILSWSYDMLNTGKTGSKSGLASWVTLETV